MFDSKRKSWYCQCRSCVIGVEIIDRFVRAEDVDQKEIDDLKDMDDMFMCVHPQTGARFINSKQYKEWDHITPWNVAYEAFFKELYVPGLDYKYRDYYHFLEVKPKEKEERKEESGKAIRKAKWGRMVRSALKKG